MDVAEPNAVEKAHLQTLLKLETMDTVGIPDAIKHATIIHNEMLKSLRNFHDLYMAQPSVAPAHENASPGAQDLLRAMLLFACSGLDAVVKQLIEDALETVLKHDLGAQRELQKFVERRLKRNSSSDETERGTLDITLLSQLLVSFDVRSHLIGTLRYSLSSDSLQSRDQILKVAAHFAITRDDVMASPDDTKRAFDARNQIVHEMDIQLDNGDQRRVRDYLNMSALCENVAAISARFIETVATKLG